MTKNLENILQKILPFNLKSQDAERTLTCSRHLYCRLKGSSAWDWYIQPREPPQPPRAIALAKAVSPAPYDVSEDTQTQ